MRGTFNQEILRERGKRLPSAIDVHNYYVDGVNRRWSLINMQDVLAQGRIDRKQSHVAPSVLDAAKVQDFAINNPSPAWVNSMAGLRQNEVDRRMIDWRHNMSLPQGAVDREALNVRPGYSVYDMTAADYPVAIQSLFTDLSDPNLPDNLYQYYLDSNSDLNQKAKANLISLDVPNISANKRVEQLAVFQTDRQRMRDIITTLSANEALNPVQQGHQLSEAMTIANRYDVLPTHVSHLRSPLEKIRGLERSMRRSATYQDRQSKATLVQMELDQMTSQLSELLFQSKGDKSTQTKNYNHYSKMISDSLKKSLDQSGTAAEKVQRLRTLSERLTYSTDRDLQNVADYLNMNLKVVDKHAGSKTLQRKAIDNLLSGIESGGVETAMAAHLRERPVHESRLLKEIISEDAAIQSKQSGYVDLMLKRLKADPAKYAEILGDLGLDAADPELATKLKDAVMQRIAKPSDVADPILMKLKPLFPGWTRQQEFSVAAMEAMNTAYTSKTTDPESWIRNALVGTPASQAMLKRDLEAAIRLRRIKLSPSDVEADLAPESIRAEAEILMKGQVLQDKTIAKYVAENQLNRDVRYHRAAQDGSTMYVRGIGEVRVNRAWSEQVLASTKRTGDSATQMFQSKDQSISKMMVELSRVSHDIALHDMKPEQLAALKNPTYVTAHGSVDDWKAIIGSVLGSPEESNVVNTLKRLQAFDMPTAPVSQAAVVQDIATNVPKLILPSELSEGLRWSAEQQRTTAIDSMLRSWTPWLVPDTLPKPGATRFTEKQERFLEARNSMYTAVSDEVGGQLMDFRNVEEFSNAITNRYRPILGRFFHWMGMEPHQIPGISDQTVGLIDRSVSALRSSGASIDLHTAMDSAVVHDMWERARAINQELRNVSAGDFQRVIQMLSATKYNSLSLSQSRYAEEDGTDILGTIASNEGDPEAMFLRQEERAERRGNKDWGAWDEYKRMTKIDKRDKSNVPTTPRDALTQLSGQGYKTDDLLAISRRSPKARQALAEMAAETAAAAGVPMGSAEDIRALVEADRAANGRLRFTVAEGDSVVADGRAEIVPQGGIRIGNRTYMTDEEKRLNTFTAFTDTLEADPRHRFGYVGRASNLAELDGGELPIVRLPDFERSILSGRSYREGIDSDATFLNMRAIARGERGVVLDTEYFNVLEHKEIAGVSQLLQVAYHDLDNRKQRGVFNVQPRQELMDFVAQRMDMYRTVHEQLDYVGYEEVAKQFSRTGIDQALMVQQERDVMNAMHYLAKLTPDDNLRALVDSNQIFQFERVGSRRTVVGIRDFKTAESVIMGTLSHLQDTGVGERMALASTMSSTIGSVIVGQNITNADFAMLQHTADRVGANASGVIGAPRVELEAVAHYLYPEGVAGKASWSVENLINILPPSNRVRKSYESGAHTAGTDVRAEAEIFKRMQWEMKRRKIDPAAIATYQEGSFFATQGSKSLGLDSGIYQITGTADANKQFALALRRKNNDGSFSEVPPITRGSRGEILADMQQYGDIVDTVEQAKSRMDDQLWQSENDRLGYAFNKGLYHVEQLLDAGSGGARSEKTAQKLLESVHFKQVGKHEGKFTVDAFPGDGERGSQLLAMSQDQVIAMRRQTFSPDMVAAGERLGAIAGTPGMTALYDTFTETEAIVRGLHGHEQAGENMVADLLTAHNEGIKELAGERALQGRYRLPEIAINGTNVTMMIDEHNPSRSMWRNVQNVAKLVQAPLESDRTSSAIRLMHEHLRERDLVSPLAEGANFPSVDLMARQAMQRVDRSNNVSVTDYPGLIDIVGSMNQEEAGAFRESMLARLNATDAAKAVSESLPASAQRDAFRQAIGDLTAQDMRVPLPLYTSLPIQAEATGYIGVKGGQAFSPPELVSAIDQTAMSLQEKRGNLRTLNYQLATRPNLRPQYEKLSGEIKNESDNLKEYLRAARGRYSDNDQLSELLGLQDGGMNTMLMFGEQSFAGRRIGDLAVGEVPYALSAVNRSPLGSSQLGQQIAAELTNVNEQIIERGLMGRPETAVSAALNQARPVRVSSPAGLTAPPRIIAPPVTEAIAEVETIAQKALQQGSGPTMSREYSITEKLITGIESMQKQMKAKYVLPAIAGAVILGAYTLGGRGGADRPSHDQAPAPDGQYDQNTDDLASKPLPPDITMGRQAYVEPNGTGLTVRLRTRGPQDPGQISSLVQGALGGMPGQMSVTVQDHRQALDNNWLQQQFAKFL